MRDHQNRLEDVPDLKYTKTINRFCLLLFFYQSFRSSVLPLQSVNVLTRNLYSFESDITQPCVVLTSPEAITPTQPLAADFVNEETKLFTVFFVFFPYDKASRCHGQSCCLLTTITSSCTHDLFTHFCVHFRAGFASEIVASTTF